MTKRCNKCDQVLHSVVSTCSDTAYFGKTIWFCMNEKCNNVLDPE